MQEPTEVVVAYQRRLFERLEEFFVRATGKHASDFAPVDGFSEVVRREAHELAGRCRNALPWVEKELREIYAQESQSAFRSSRQLGGLKLVLGGSGRFLGGHLNSVSRAILYADTVFIPDPVMPWLESSREEERFRHVLFLQAVHVLLQLKPLVDADLPYPPVLVFPSWEKTLEDKDRHTQEGIFQPTADVFSHYVDRGLASLGDVRKLAERDPDRFLSAVDQHRIFIAPGGPLDEPLGAALRRYEADVETWRSQDWLERYRALPPHMRVLNAVIERLAPQYHLLENAEELGGHPLLSLEQHAHYYRLVSETNSARLEYLGLLGSKTRAMVDGLSSQRLKWLSALPLNMVVELRKNNENATFRRRLQDAVGRLHESLLSDVDKVAAAICHELSDAIAEHDRDLVRIEAKYERIHGQTAVTAIAAAGTALIPSLAPFLGLAAPLALATKYAWDKIAERAEKGAMTKSLVGVLAAVRAARE